MDAFPEAKYFFRVVALTLHRENIRQKRMYNDQIKKIYPGKFALLNLDRTNFRQLE